MKYIVIEFDEDDNELNRYTIEKPDYDYPLEYPIVHKDAVKAGVYSISECNMLRLQDILY